MNLIHRQPHDDWLVAGPNTTTMSAGLSFRDAALRLAHGRMVRSFGQ